MKKRYGVFDIIGPIMIGPSSSHTAGAAKLAKIARGIAGEEPVEVKFYLHGSFSKTYKGHGTDRALVAGILGMDPADENLKESLKLAKMKGMSVSFEPKDLGDVHPNTVRITMKLKDGHEVTITGSSIGGGAVEISQIDGEEIQFSGNYPTLLVSQRDAPGVVANISRLLYENGINIAFMSLFRSQKGRDAMMIFELDQNIDKNILEKLTQVESVEHVRFVPLSSDVINYPVV
ncbi:MAG TPA: L-serine ammonia-lyase, iron-sulfur-dependent subunit beta [Proteiniclasticum sp.]|nr:L-serine ammonia-lyase, iron-sulfur-dependent subunit beta [Proteiniclasticum sp.]